MCSASLGRKHFFSRFGNVTELVEHVPNVQETLCLTSSTIPITPPLGRWKQEDQNKIIPATEQV